MKPIQFLFVFALAFLLGIAADRIFLRENGTGAQSHVSGNPVSPASLLGRSNQKSNPVPGEIDDHQSTPSPGSRIRATDLVALVDDSDPFNTGEQMRQKLSNLSPDALVALLKDLENQSDATKGLPTARTSVFNHLATAAPRRAVDYVIGLSNIALGRTLTNIAFRALAKANINEARQSLRGITDKQIRKTAQNAILSVAIDSDPELAAVLMGEFNTDKSHTGYANLYWDCGNHIAYPVFSTYSSGIYYSQTASFNNNGTVSRLAAKNPKAAESYARSLNDPSKRSDALVQVAQGWAQSDPEAALTWARSLKKSDGRDGAVFNVLSHMASQDPKRVAGMMNQLSNNHQTLLIRSITFAWIKKDQDSALAWLESLPASQARSQGYNSAIQSLTSKDPKAASDLLDHVPINDRARTAGNIASAWVSKDPLAARDWVTQLNDPQSMQAGLERILGVWTNKDPQSAMDFLDNDAQELPLRNLNNLYANLANNLPESDRLTALDWARQIHNDKYRRTVLSPLYRTWASRDAKGLTDHLGAIEDPEERSIAFSAVASQMPVREPDTALEWFGGLEKEEQNSIGPDFLSSLVRMDPNQATEIFDQLVDSGDETTTNSIRHSADSIGTAMAQTDPVVAARWAEQIDDEETRVKAVEGVVNSWIQFDSFGASEWISSLPAGKSFDQAAERLAKGIQNSDPSSAFEWAQSIGDESRRTSITEDILRNWIDIDAESAQEALRSADIQSETRQRLERDLESRE